MQDIIIGAEFVCRNIVTSASTALSVGSGEAEVYATPMMIALMENAAYLCLKPFLDDDESSVGILMNTTHESATPVGVAVSALARITAVDGKIVTFEVTASDAFGVIGRGEHKRAVINSQRFIDKAQKKLSVL